MIPKSLKSMLLLAVALFIVVTGIAVSQLVAHRYSVSLLDAATARAVNMAHNLALEAADQILINDLVSLQKMLDDQVASEPSVAYLFIMREGTLLTHTFTDGVPVNLLSANTLTGAFETNIKKVISQEGQRFIDVAFPIFGGKAGMLRVGLSETPYRQQVRQLWFEIGLITISILAVFLFVSHLVISRLTRPLQKLTAFAQKIDEGNLDNDIQIKGKSEVSALAAAFNHMLGRIRDYAQRLKDYNFKLEKKNQELDRTHNQLKTSFLISQKIAALSRLDQICQFLVQRLKDLVECRNVFLLVFNKTGRSINMASTESTRQTGHDTFDTIYDTFNGIDHMGLIRKSAIEPLQLPEPLGEANQIAVFPIRHHDLILGAMVVACEETCRCVRTELAVISMVLQQAAGAIHRANSHEEELRELRQHLEKEVGFSSIIGKDPQMQIVFQLIDDVAPTDATVLIQGESGTGKELVAKAIHDRSHRANRPFIVINCAAYPSTLLESELFGHEKGAFTGALRRKIGRFERADGGTVFLDEIGEIDPTAQTKLLRVLQQQIIDRLGGEKSIKVNVRILAATNKNLFEAVQAGGFREDLFYRLNVIPIDLPPLRKRQKDIYLLARHFLARFAEEHSKQIMGFRSETMRCLLDNQWPGNVRELENSIEHAVVLAKGHQIELTDLPSSLTKQTLPSTVESQTDAIATIVESEENTIRQALEACSWNKAEAARKLGISRSTLYVKLKKLKINTPTLH